MKSKIKQTTLCYIKKDGQYLMLLRNKKEHDLNEGKWIGIGGKFKKKENAERCLLREVKEETGLTLTRWHFHGIIFFRSDVWEDEAMYLYTADGFEGELQESCDEGELAWIDEEKMFDLNLWEGDRIFLQKIMDGEERFSLTLRYEGDKLVEANDWCAQNGICGGCAYGGYSYDEQLKEKENKVFDTIKSTLDAESVWEGMVASPLTQAYKNKMDYSFGDEIKDGPLTLGMHKKKSFYSVVTCDNCRIVHEDYNRIVRATVDFFDGRGVPYHHRKMHEGFLRHLLLRRSFADGKILVDLVSTSESCYDREIDDWKKMLLELELEGRIGGILRTKNDSLSDAVIDEGTECLYGEDFIEEELLGLRFKITPFSFFQTNTKGAEALYSKVREYAGDTAGKVVYDLYCGTGTIAQIVAPAAKRAYGVEIIEEAVAAARENAARNGLANCEFYAGDVLDVFEEKAAGFDKADVIILDPPRDGLHPKMLPVVAACKAPEIVYVACKPASFARDMEYFAKEGYRVAKACAVDQFPFTKHVEVVSLLSRTGGTTREA